MNIELYLIIFFAILFLGTNIFWLSQYNKLLNKFMSRNYVEFVQAEKLGKPSQIKAKPSVEVDPYDEQRARDLNQLMGMV